MKLTIVFAAFAFVFLATDGENLYREGRYEASYAAFDEIARQAGREERAASWFNAGLAAYQAFQFQAADTAFEKSEAWGEVKFTRLREFMMACTEFGRCLRGEALSRRVEAGLPAFDSAIAAGQRAQEAWQQVVLSYPGWQEAKRNLERTLLKLADLEKRRQEFVDKSKKNAPPEDKPADKEDGKKKEEKKQEFEEEIDANLEALLSSEVGQLLKLIKKKEAQKKKLRLKERTGTSAAGGRDW